MATVPFHSNWILLDRFVRCRDDDSFPGDSPTAASITNSRGDLFDVCLDLNAPPRPSNLILKQHRLNREDGIGKGNMTAYHTLGTTNNGKDLKFAFVLSNRVVAPDRDSSDFTVITWKLKIEETSMLWIHDTQITASDLWLQDDFAPIPRDLLLYPTFSVHDPNEVSFVLKHEPTELEDGTYDASQIWIVSVDMLIKKLKSSALYVKEQEEFTPDEAELSERKSMHLEAFIPVEVPKHVNLKGTK
ncbi:hypothetical protein QOZ80_5BG0440830 [Eleusine coracana subsp. coracana]|nr:hypothetical protein QOZ80_5BG0440830 [Eleusine coracana subsp. coracana]